MGVLILPRSLDRESVFIKIRCLTALARAVSSLRDGLLRRQMRHSSVLKLLAGRRLDALACGHLGMTQSKNLKENFQKLVSEMEETGYLPPSLRSPEGLKGRYKESRESARTQGAEPGFRAG